MKARTIELKVDEGHNVVFLGAVSAESSRRDRWL